MLNNLLQSEHLDDFTLRFRIKHPGFFSNRYLEFDSSNDAANSFLIRRIFGLQIISGDSKSESYKQDLGSPTQESYKGEAGPGINSGRDLSNAGKISSNTKSFISQIIVFQDSITVKLAKFLARSNVTILEAEISEVILSHLKSGMTMFEYDNELSHSNPVNFSAANPAPSASEKSDDPLRVLNVELTPNPHAFKINLDRNLNGSGTYITSIEEATNSAMARAIFSISHVRAVFIGSNFITITTAEPELWEVDQDSIINIIQGFPDAIDPTIQSKLDSATLSQIEKEIISILDTMIRPSVQSDGGEIIFKKFENGKVFLELIGACSGCPSASITLKNGIERTLKHYIPEVEEVVAGLDVN